MSRTPSFAGVILAAGESSRMGTDKALLPWPPTAAGQLPSSHTFLSAAIHSFSLSTDFIVVVAGKNEAALAPIAYANGASIVSNPDPARGQFSSLQVGVRELLNRGRDAAIITLVDRPPASIATVQSLRAVFEAAGNEVWAVIPEFTGKHGHPFLIGREMIEAFLHAPPTSTAREVEHTHQDCIRYVAVDDPNVTLNINTPDDYVKLSGLTSKMS
jgi:molybdenum cofactor cytidylyltransferase